METTNLFNYTHFRTFLTDHAQEKKKTNIRWSYGLWARQLQLGNSTSLTRVLKGGRRPGKQMQEKLCQYFQFGPQEQEYFHHLILLDKVGDDDTLSTLVMEKLRHLHPQKKFDLLPHEIFTAMSHWHYFALREMVSLPDFQEDPNWIVKRLRPTVTEREISQALKTLEGLRMLERDASGRLQPAGPNLESVNDIASEASKRNHEQNLDLAKQALRSVPLELREFNAACLNIKDSDLPEAKEMIRQFKRRFISRFESAQTGDNTAIIQIQLFPYTQKKKGDSQCQL